MWVCQRVKRVPLNPLADHHHPGLGFRWSGKGWNTTQTYDMVRRVWLGHANGIIFGRLVVFLLAKWGSKWLRVFEWSRDKRSTNLVAFSDTADFWRLLSLGFANCRCSEILRSLPPRCVPRVCMELLRRVVVVERAKKPVRNLAETLKTGSFYFAR